MPSSIALGANDGQSEAAAREYRTLLSHYPDQAQVHSTYLIALQYDPCIGAQQLLEEHRAWAAAHIGEVAVARHPRRTVKRPRYLSDLALFRRTATRNKRLHSAVAEPDGFLRT